jgi:two-component system, chemotaxis family, chemotaxis protein CheY
VTPAGATPQRPILVVDDDETILTSIEFFLNEEGYAVVTAPNGEVALQRVAQHQPALILIDMKMPVMDAWAFAAAYRAQPGPYAPLVVMTAAHDSRARAAEIGADDCLAKPFDVDKLLEVIQRYVPAS